MEIRQPYAPGAPHDRGPGYERRDANVRGLLQFAFWMAVVLVVTLVGMKYTFDHFKKVQPLGATTSPMVSEAERTLPPKLKCLGDEDELQCDCFLDMKIGSYRRKAAPKPSKIEEKVEDLPDLRFFQNVWAYRFQVLVSGFVFHSLQ